MSETTLPAREPQPERRSSPVVAAGEETSAARAALRSGFSPRYSGQLHFAFTSALGWSTVLLALSWVQAPTALELLTVPLTLLYANAVEYFGHKGPMHHRKPGLSLVFRRHALEHHRFFTEARMAIDSARDVKMVLFPPVLIVFFFGLFAVPAGLLVRALLGTNVAALFVASSMTYFLLYETLHLTYHLGEGTLLGRLSLVKQLRRHHARHHDPSRMAAGNFNITFPICDAIFGTLLGPSR